jgi:hypothetical protein
MTERTSSAQAAERGIGGRPRLTGDPPRARAGLYVDRLARSVEKHTRRKDTFEALDELLLALRTALGPLANIPGDVDFAIEGSIPMIMWRPQQAVWDLLSPVVVEGVADQRAEGETGAVF